MKVMFTKWRRRKRGSAIVEAALFLPFFLLALLSLILIIRLVSVEGSMMEICTKEAQIVAKEAYLTNLPEIPEGVEKNIVGGLAHGTLMKLRIRQAVDSKEKLPLSELRLQSFFYLFSAHETDSLIRPSFTYQSSIPLPGGFGRTIKFKRVFLFRAFVGSVGMNSAMGFTEMEKEESSELVSIFPRAGKRYHKKNCKVITVYPIETLLTNAVQRKYSPCSLCKPNENAFGSKVYLFPESGEVFHRENCVLVKRYVTEIEKQEAIKKGYSPCKLCGG
ncbi:MAG: hypothetical protein PHQ50_00170 [Eubacteriales bacterium]|nr:hypothetical protein [Eubacteriales bacterium]MDD3349298.1 hypothetical protein [Eubacteriales bacterium]